jgi:putative PIN family toxin of toxin-antitoxin system
MIYAVVDTNVLVSALLSKNPLSPTVQVLEHILNGDIIPLIDDTILEEYLDVLNRPHFRLQSVVIDRIIHQFKKKGVYTDRTPFDEIMPDEDDRVFYEIALTVEDSFLVTGNLKHYPRVPKVVTPAEFIQIVY